MAMYHKVSTVTVQDTGIVSMKDVEIVCALSNHTVKSNTNLYSTIRRKRIRGARSMTFSDFNYPKWVFLIIFEIA